MADFNYGGEGTLSRLLSKVKKKMDEQSEQINNLSKTDWIPLRIYAIKQSSGSYKQEIIEGGATQTYTASEIHELVSQRVVTIETYTSSDASKGQGLHQYFDTSFKTDGTVNQVHFRGVYVNDQYKLVPSYVSVDSFGTIFVSDEEWSGGSVETDATLTKNGVPANAKTVGDRLTVLSEAIEDKMDADKLPEAVNEALEQAKESGEFDGAPGQDGYTPQKGVDYFDGAPGKDGADGQPGENGQDGKDGSDGVGIASIKQTTTSAVDGGDNVFTVTLTNGTSATFTVKNGSKGSTGADGADGKDGSDANVTAENIKNALGYTPADNADVEQLSEAIDNLSKTDWIPSKEWDEYATLFEDVLSFTSDTVYLSSGNTFSIQPQVPYRVIWNGVIYDCVGKTYDDQPYLGNGRLVHGNYVEDTGEPFGFIAGIFSDIVAYVVKSVSAPEDISVKVTTGNYTYNKMPDVYLPASVVKSVNGMTPDENGNVAIASMSPGGDAGGETGGGSSSIPPLRIYAIKQSSGSYKQEIIEGGATQTYTASEIHELVSQRVVTIETYTSSDASKGQGLHQYFDTSFKTNGTVNQVHFRGVYINDQYKLVPSYVSVDAFGTIFVSDEEWSGGSVETDATLTENGVPANAKTVGDRLNALSEQIANSGGSGGTSIDVTAQVGQTIVVKEVDSSGKPTKWEAAEYQPRTHWTETNSVELLETTVEIDPDVGMSLIPAEFTLVGGKKYTVMYNGVEYADCECLELAKGIYSLGNIGVVDENFPITDHPFCVARAQIDADENGNPIFAWFVAPVDGSTTVTLSILDETGIVHKLEEKYLPDSVPHVETHGDVILSDYVLTITDEEFIITEPMGTVTIGANYEVKIGSRTFQCTAKENSIYTEMYYAEVSDENINVIIHLVRPAFATAIGYYGYIGKGAIEGETLSISAAYTAHKIDNRCMPPSFFFIPVQEDYNFTTDEYTYTSDYTYEEVRNRIEMSGDIPVLCVGDYPKGIFEIYYAEMIAADRIPFYNMSAVSGGGEKIFLKALYWDGDGITDTQ